MSRSTVRCAVRIPPDKSEIRTTPDEWQPGGRVRGASGSPYRLIGMQARTPRDAVTSPTMGNPDHFDLDLLRVLSNGPGYRAAFQGRMPYDRAPYDRVTPYVLPSACASWGATVTEPPAYDPESIEARWRERWHSPDLSCQATSRNGRHTYLVSICPSPAGQLHMRQVRVYTSADTLARFRRSRGDAVLTS